MRDGNEPPWFSLVRQPQEPVSRDAPTLTGTDLDEWRSQFDPFLRYLKRRKVVLALSGGGMAMPCHVSVLRVLEILGVPISRVYGTSAGAVVGGLYAAGASVADLERIMLGIRSPDDIFGFGARHPAVRLAAGEVVRAIVGASFERSGIYGSERIEEYLQGLMKNYIGGVPKMGDLKLPFSCVAFDIGTGRQTGGRRERTAKRIFSVESTPDVSLADAVGASMSIPGTLPPKKIEDHYYIDGASVEHLPIVTAFDDWESAGRFRRKRTVVIAVDLGYGGNAPSEASICHPMDLILYSSSIQSRAITDYSLLHCHRPRRGFSVVLLRPRTMTIGICDTGKIPEALESSYAETVRQLSGDGFMRLTEDHIEWAGSFLGLGALRRKRRPRRTGSGEGAR